MFLLNTMFFEFIYPERIFFGYNFLAFGGTGRGRKDNRTDSSQGHAYRLTSLRN